MLYIQAWIVLIGGIGIQRGGSNFYQMGEIWEANANVTV